MAACPFDTDRVDSPIDGASATNGDHGKAKEVDIPQPPPHFFMGNIPDVEPAFPSRSWSRFAELYGEIYQLDFKVYRLLIVSSQELANEACDADRFTKNLSRIMLQVRALIGDGLFSSAHEDGPTMKREENWWKAHRLLTPAFGPLGLRKMYDDMADLSSQLVLRWDRMAGSVIDVVDDFTRLAFDTIGLCSFGYRFNEFYSEHPHPFAHQMGTVLLLSSARASRNDFQNSFHIWEERERQANIHAMHTLCRDIIADRKANPKPEAKDLLNLMLNAEDRETGERLSEDCVVYNLVTFLLAGHETTSSTLAFLYYHLLKNPRTLHTAQAQVDAVVGDKVVTLEMIPDLPYIDACIKETLRLSNPIPGFNVAAKQDTFLGNGKYRVRKGDGVLVNLDGLHHDPKVWGDDHKEFKPERFLDGKLAKLPPNSWKPFGNGIRACIGRGFTEQEMMINIAMVLQKFNLEMADHSYVLKLKSTITVKPDGFFMRVRRRPGKTLWTGIPGGSMPGETTRTQDQHQAAKQAAVVGAPAVTKPVKLFFGGNSGTCEGFAQNLEERLIAIGLEVEIARLDAATENLSTESINIFITASYEGQPPDNAKIFISWLESLKGSDKLKDVSYSVFGVGNSDWAQTFLRIPRLVDQKLAELGAVRLIDADYANVKTDLMGPFEDWSAALISRLRSSEDEDEKSTLVANLEVNKLARELGGDSMGVGVVLENVQLADASIGLEKRHMEVRLPDSSTYEAGDYLVVQPKNPEEVVRRVMRFFKLVEHTRVNFSGSKKKFLPSEPIAITVFLSSHVELSAPITKRQLRTLISHADPSQKPTLSALQDEQTWTIIQANRYSTLDILEEHPTIPLPFATYIDMLLPLTPRQYSISSSPLSTPHTVSITYDIHTSPSLSGHGTFEGASSTYLASRRVGDQISCFVRPTNVGFRLPAQLETPVIMFAAGTGIAPMRAFVQERAALAGAGRKLGEAVLFFGCRDRERDFLYREELAAWEGQGVVRVYGAFSREGGGGARYVQDAIWERREEVRELFERGGKIYLCGSAAKLGQSCADVCKRIYSEGKGVGEEEAEAWLESVRSVRYISDVY